MTSLARIPVGVPTSCFACIKDNGDNPDEDLSKSDTSIQIHEPGTDKKPKTYDNLDGIFDFTLDTPEKIFEQMFGSVDASEQSDSIRPPALKALVEDGVSLAAFFIGPMNGNKTAFFQGMGENDHGAIGWTCDQIFNLVSEKEESIDGQYKATITVSFYELYEEVIIDLLEPENNKLDKPRMDSVHGYCVPGMTSKQCKATHDIISNIENGRNNRKSQIFSTGPASSSTSAIFELILKQEDMENGVMYSKMMIVEVPGTEKLTLPSDKIRQKEGPLLSKSLFAFHDVCKSLAGRKERFNAPFEQSLLTQLLHDALGADSEVMAIACIAQGDPKVSKETMNLLKLMRKMTHYPIENSELTQGIMVKYRTAIATLLDRVEEIKAMKVQPTGTDNAVLERIKDLEKMLLEANIEATTAKEDGAKVYKMLELFKAKYSKIVEMKAEQAKELIRSEEQTLEISKALLELKLENSEMTEKFETEKYEITTNMLNAKNEVSDLEIKLADTKDVLEKSESMKKQALDDREEMRKELEKLHDNFIAMKEKQNLEHEKNLELGTELLTLRNQKDSFGKMNASLNAKCETQEIKIREFELRISKGEEEAVKLGNELEKNKQLLEDVRAEKIKVELKLTKSEVDFGQNRLDLDRSTAEFVRTRDNELFQVRKGAEEEIREIRNEKDELKKVNLRLEASQRQLERKIRDLDLEVERSHENTVQMIAVKNMLETQLANAREQYRSKLLNYLGEEALAAQLANEEMSALFGDDKEGGGTGREENNSSSSGGGKSKSAATSEANSRAALEDLIKTYKDRESKISQDLEQMRVQNAEIVRKNTFLYNKYNSLKDILEDVAPDKNKVPVDLPKESEIKVTASELEMQKENELRGLRSVVKQMQNEMSTQQDKNVQVSETYRQMVQEMEGRMKDLAQKLSIVTNEKERLEREKVEERDGETLKQIEDMQQNIIEQLSSIKGVEGGSVGGDAGMSQKEREELHELRRFKRKHKDATGKGKGKENSKSGIGEEARAAMKENFGLKEEIKRLQRKLETMAAFEGGGDFGAGGGGAIGSGEQHLRDQIMDRERKIAELETKNVMLSEELSNYKSYMDSTVKKYKKTIKALKQE